MSDYFFLFIIFLYIIDYFFPVLTVIINVETFVHVCMRNVCAYTSGTLRIAHSSG